MNRIGGARRKSRYKYKKETRRKGKISTSSFMQRFQPGQKVYLTVEPSFHHGLYHSRFHGKTGTIKELRGRCYEVVINDRGKNKTLLVHPLHLKAPR